MLRLISLLAGMLICHVAGAQSLYKCKGANGVTAYQEKPCSADADTVDRRWIAAEPDSASKKVTSGGNPVTQSTLTQQFGGYVAQNRMPGTAPTPVAPNSNGDKSVGYACSANGSTWFQEEPCPKFKTAHGYWADTGQSGTSFTTVEQRPATKKDMCSGKLSTGSSARDTYAKKKIRC